MWWLLDWEPSVGWASDQLVASGSPSTLVNWLVISGRTAYIETEYRKVRSTGHFSPPNWTKSRTFTITFALAV